jgi:hypothetical protein
MGWNDFYQRREAIELVLRQAARNPESELAFEEIPAVVREFADREELLLAMQHKWMQMLTGKVAVALDEAEHDPRIDGVEALARSWRDLAAEQPVLRRVLDVHTAEAGDALHAAVGREHRMVALAAGLADPFEPVDEVTRIGSAFVSLIRGTSQETVSRRRNPVERLISRLIPSA